MSNSVDLTLTFISNYKDDDLNNLLKLIDFSDIPKNYFMDYLVLYLNACSEYNNLNAIPILFKHLKFYGTIDGSYEDDLYVVTNKYIDVSSKITNIKPTILIRLLREENLEDSNYLIIVKSFPKVYTHIFLLHELSLLPQDENTLSATTKIFDILGKPPKYIMDEAIKFADDNAANYLYDYLVNYVNSYAETPLYMDNKYSEIEENKLSLPILKTYMNDIYKKLLDKYDEDEVNSLLPYLEQILQNIDYEELTPELKSVLSKNDLEPLMEIYRVLGPANTIIPSNYPNIKDIDIYNYQNRMFYCIKAATDDDDANNFNRTNDWFTGQCLYCGLKIAKRYYAVREPCVGGYWKNCYCSWDCVIYNLNYIRSLNYINDEETNDVFANQILLVIMYAKLTDKYKIYDRKVVKEE